ncbi:MAG TPA: hypothetical protein VGC91_16080 [Pyrinomonadaceae bacterium]|jgi:hypothetical protein
MRGRLLRVGSSVSRDESLKPLFLSITYAASSLALRLLTSVRGMDFAIAAFQRTPHP